jgi:hypothetical protein
MPGQTKPAARTPADAGPTPRPGVDASGRLLPGTEAERRARARARGMRAALEGLAEIADEADTPETWAEVFRGIDSARPERPLFEGLY